jgi:hypothetical protein
MIAEVSTLAGLVRLDLRLCVADARRLRIGLAALSRHISISFSKCSFLHDASRLPVALDSGNEERVMTKVRNSGGRRRRTDTTPQIVEGEVTASTTGARKKQVPHTDAEDRAAGDRESKAPASHEATGVPDVIVPLRHRHDGWTPIRQRAFLRYLSELGSMTDACKRVGMSKTSAERLRKRSPDFAAAWDKAVSIVAPILEQAAYERGVEGWDEPIFHAGVQVGVKRRFSDASLRMLMQARSRAEAMGMPVPDLATASIEELNAFAQKAAKLAGGVFMAKGKGKSQEEVDAALLKRLDDLALHARRKVTERGEVWLDGGGYPPDLSVSEAKDFRSGR